MSNIIYISKKCQHSKKLLIMIYKNPMLKQMFRIVCVENGPIPPFIKNVPTLFNETNNSIISGNDLFNLIGTYVKQNNTGPENTEPSYNGDDQRNNATTTKSEINNDEELSPWNGGEMGGGISSCYSFLDNENPIQNSFELIGGSSVAGVGISDMSKPIDSSGGEGSDKRKLFDSDYESFIKSRNDGIPQGNHRA